MVTCRATWRSVRASKPRLKQPVAQLLLHSSGAPSRLALSASHNLRDWAIVHEVLFHPDPVAHALQYVDRVIDGADIAFLSRTAFAAGAGDRSS